MTALPHRLRPWEPTLGVFPAEVGTSLGGLVARLAPAFGDLPTPASEDGGEPDGFDGLDRTGTYERLLIGEWALADLEPDEFARRAAEGEHAFLRIARREPALPKTSVALFDSGPDQLGSPRVAHLAILVLMAARAERAGASFGWQVLNHEPEALQAGVTESSVRALLDGRTARRVGASDLVRWAERLGRGPRVDDLWVVGSEALDGIAPALRFSRVIVREVLDPRLRQLDVCVIPAVGARRRVVLDLPDDRDCARLVRDPFLAASPSTGRAPSQPGSNLVFASNGTKVFARASRGGVLAYPIPNSPKAGVGRVKHYYPEWSSVVAVGWSQRSVVVARTRGEHLVLKAFRNLSAFHGSDEIAVPWNAEVSPFGSSKSPPLLPVIFGTAWGLPRAPFHLVDPGGALLAIGVESPVSGGAPVAVVHRVAERVSAVARLDDGGLLFVGCGVHIDDDGFVRWKIVRTRPDGPPIVTPLPGSGPFDAFIGRIRRTPGRVAVRTNAHEWTLFDDDSNVTLSLDRGETVVGVAPQEVPALVTVAPSRRTVRIVSRHHAGTLFTAADELADVLTSTTSERMACVSAHGELVALRIEEPRAIILARYEARR